MSSINLQTPIIYPSVVFFSICIVTIKKGYDTDKCMSVVHVSDWVSHDLNEHPIHSGVSMKSTDPYSGYLFCWLLWCIIQNMLLWLSSKCFTGKQFKWISGTECPIYWIRNLITKREMLFLSKTKYYPLIWIYKRLPGLSNDYSAWAYWKVFFSVPFMEINLFSSCHFTDCST